MPGITLRCSACGAGSEAPVVVPGSVDPCACGGVLALAAPVPFRCPGCGAASRPSLLPLDRARPCPRCGTAVQAVALGYAPTVQRPPSPVVAAPPPPIPDAADAGLDPTRPAFAVWDGAGLRPEEPLVQAGAGLAPGSSFGRYRIERELGRGGMGVVYAAHDPALKRTVALKVLIAGELAGEEAVARFVREARSAGSLHHAHIIAVHDAGCIEGRHFFTMDLIDAVDLSRAARQVELRRALEWMRQVCLAVHHAHEKGIIHRDLKPGNILIEKKGGRPLVMDFGLAKDFSSTSFQSLSGAIMGTPAYMSPEQARGEVRSIDRRSDIHSLGAILYELACGRRAFGGDTVFATMRAVVSELPPAPRPVSGELPPGLAAVIQRCLEKDPAARYQTARELALELGRIVAGHQVAARGMAWHRVAWQSLRQRPRVLAAAGAAVAVLLLGVLLLLLWPSSPAAQLRRALADADPAIGRAAIVLVGKELAEGRLGGADREELLAELRQRLAAPDDAVAAAAEAALATARDVATPSLLRARALDAALVEAARLRAAATLGAWGPTARGEGAALAGGVAPAPASIAAALAAAALSLDPGSISILGPIVSDEQRPTAWRVALVQAIGRSRPSLESDSMKLLIRLAGSADEDVGAAAVAALEHVRSRDIIIPLYGLEAATAEAAVGLGRMAATIAQRDRQMAALLAEQEAEERANTVQLGDKPKAPPPPGERIRAITDRLAGGDRDARLAAAIDLGRLGDAAAVPALLRCLDDRDGGVRRAAGRGLIALAPKAAIDTTGIADRLATARPEQRDDLVWLLGELQARETAPAVLAAVREASEAPRRRAAARALARLGDPAALALLRAWVTELRGADATDPGVAVVEALAARQAWGGAAAGDLVALLEHPTRALREAALTGLVAASGEQLGPRPERWRAWLATRASVTAP